MVLISYLIVSIEWVSYSQKKCGYCKMTLEGSSQKITLAWIGQRN